jgi:lipopolysaccharide/colanic/teichoic acid biosynthesis glycosyltransferase
LKLKLHSLGKGDIHFDELATAVSRVYTVTVFRYFICALSSMLSKALRRYQPLRREALALIITIIIIIIIIIIIQSHTKGTHI